MKFDKSLTEINIKAQKEIIKHNRFSWEISPFFNLFKTNKNKMLWKILSYIFKKSYKKQKCCKNCIFVYEFRDCEEDSIWICFYKKYFENKKLFENMDKKSKSIEIEELGTLWHKTEYLKNKIVDIEGKCYLWKQDGYEDL